MYSIDKIKTLIKNKGIKGAGIKNGGVVLNMCRINHDWHLPIYESGAVLNAYPGNKYNNSELYGVDLKGIRTIDDRDIKLIKSVLMVSNLI